MTKKMPVVRQISWLMVIPQFVVIAILSGLAAWVIHPEPLYLALAYGSCIYLLYSYGSRWLLLKSQRAGMKLARQHAYAEAAQEFAESYRFFTEHAWIDGFRSLTLMSPSALSYQEVALMNRAFCYGQMGEIAKAKSDYEQVLTDFPDNEMAKLALNLIKSAESQNQIND